jgi:hypothetical protein
MTCAEAEHIVYDVAADSCSCECDAGYVFDSNTNSCTFDDSCVPKVDSCVDFAKCINPFGHINVVGDADCVETACTSGYTGSNPETDGFGYEVSCPDADSYLSNNGASSTGFIACNCDGKTDCKWETDDIKGDITEDGICVTDSSCPVSKWNDFTGLQDPSGHRFISDPQFNVKQNDLYDGGKGVAGQAEVLGLVQTSAVADFASWNWIDGHYLVLVWENSLASHVTVTPYGDYYEPVISDFGDGTVQVFETFVNFMVC